MPCLCTTNTLRHFIRSVAQVDVLGSAQQTRLLLPAGTSTAVQSKHTTSTPNQKRGLSTSPKLQKDDLGDVFVPYSPAAIEALAAEVKPLPVFDPPHVESQPRTRPERRTHDRPNNTRTVIIRTVDKSEYESIIPRRFADTKPGAVENRGARQRPPVQNSWSTKSSGFKDKRTDMKSPRPRATIQSSWSTKATGSEDRRNASRSERSSYSKDAPGSTQQSRGSQKSDGDEISRTLYRRTKVENTGFALHFSAPRAPLAMGQKTSSEVRNMFDRPEMQASNITFSNDSSRSNFSPITEKATNKSFLDDDVSSGFSTVGSRPVNNRFLQQPSKDFDSWEEKPERNRLSQDNSLHESSSSQTRHQAIEESEERSHRTKDDWTPPPREPWMIQKEKLKEKFPDGWKPLKRLSPDALAGIRALHAQMPELYTSNVLAENFKLSPEAIRRILKSNWSPNSEEETDRQRRWFNRGKKIYTEAAELGFKAPKMWREAGVAAEKPDWVKKKEAHKEAWEAKQKQFEGRPRAPEPALVTQARKYREAAQARADAEDELY